MLKALAISLLILGSNILRSRYFPARKKSSTSCSICRSLTWLVIAREGAQKRALRCKHGLTATPLRRDGGLLQDVHAARGAETDDVREADPCALDLTVARLTA